MKGRSKKSSREKDLTSRFLRGDYDQDQVEQQQQASVDSRRRQVSKTLKTSQMRAADLGSVGEEEIEAMPTGRVVQVFSLFSEVEFEGAKCLCVVRKTLQKVSETQIVVGDLVKFRKGVARDEAGLDAEGVIERVLPRKTVVTRADSFKQLDQHPIVANASQMLVIASLLLPSVKWGLIDRMVLSARSGGLRPIVCLNKIDLASGSEKAGKILAEAREVLEYYRSVLGLAVLQTSIETREGLEEFKELLKGETTVLAGHSGVGKSSLVRAVEPVLDLRVGEISGYTGKGRHTTTSARSYPLSFGGMVVDTPGVKMFGMWGLTKDNLEGYFEDVVKGSAPEWRRESYEKIGEALK